MDGAERVVFAEDWQAAVVQVPLSEPDARQLEAMLQERQAAQLQAEIAIGIEQSDRGEVFDGETVVEELLDEIQQARQAG